MKQSPTKIWKQVTQNPWMVTISTSNDLQILLEIVAGAAALTVLVLLFRLYKPTWTESVKGNKKMIEMVVKFCKNCQKVVRIQVTKCTSPSRCAKTKRKKTKN